ncbi:MAG: LysM peptidoglycan-binding domain-containing protein [Chloroflexota bacterium]
MSPFRKTFLILLGSLLAACSSGPGADLGPAAATVTQAPGPTPTPLPTRSEYDPGQLVEYVAHSGDTLPALAARFNTTVEEILAANANIPIPADATTMPAGMPMQIPIYYRSFWGTTFQILPDSQYVNGPSAIGFDVEAFVQSRAGWLKDFRTYAQGATRTGAEVVQLVATNYSVSPRVLLDVMEYQAGALSQPVAPEGRYPLGIYNYNYPGLYMQLAWVANVLNNGYYGWRTGLLTEFELDDGRIERPDPWQTAASVAFQYFSSRMYDVEGYETAIGPDGFARVYTDLFGNPWEVDMPHIPVSLQQPALTLPFRPGEIWALTGGPHTGWGTLLPWAALDFAPGAETGGCTPTDRPAVAMADGVVVRSETGVVMLDLDGDGDERTGWNLLYLHVATQGRARRGAVLQAGDVVGYPSCEGGTATGTHIHIARKYNGEWIPADCAIPFDLDGWVAHNGDGPYNGTLTRSSQTVIACECADVFSQLQAGK